VSFNVYGGEVTFDRVGKAVPVRDVVWIGDDVPEGAVTDFYWAEPWVWADKNPSPYFGTRCSVLAGNGIRTLCAAVPWPGWQIGSDDSLFTYVYLDPTAPPKMLMLQWWAGSWEHRVYWGEDRFPKEWSKGQATSKVYMGPLPQPGQWVRLSVPATIVGLDNRTVTAVAFTVFDGKAALDNTGKAVPSTDFVWVGDQLPPGARGDSYTGEAWNWSGSGPEPFSGTKAHVSAVADGLKGHFFVNATQAMQVCRGDMLIAYAYLDPVNPPRMIMLQWHDGSAENAWGHRAYWGENLFPYGRDGSPDRCYMGPLPPAGTWVRLEVPARLVGLEGKLVRGMSFDHFGGKVAWDHTGKSSALLPEEVVWLADSLPSTATTDGFNEPAWTWDSGTPSPVVGTLTHRSPLSSRSKNPLDYHQHQFLDEGWLIVNTGDKLFAWVYLDPLNLPKMVMLQWNEGVWNHRAYWGQNLFPWGKDSPPDRVFMGSMPASGQWVRLEVPAALVGLERRAVYGIAFSMYGGAGWWGHAGKIAPRAKPLFPSDEIVWVEDDVPEGTTKMTSGDDAWLWTAEDPAPLSGARSHVSKHTSNNAPRSHHFANYSADKPSQKLTLNKGDTLICYAYLDPYDTPRMLMLEWCEGTSWDHRAYWGEDLSLYGTGTPTSKVSMGMLPPAGRWVRLEVPASAVGLEGKTVNGMAFTLAGGTVYWDRAGKAVRLSGAGLAGVASGDSDDQDELDWLPDPIGPQAATPVALQLAFDDSGYLWGVLTGQPGRFYQIEASTNLVDWVPVVAGRASSDGTLEFRDPEAALHQARFYRAIGW